MDAVVFFAGLAVTDFTAARAWYERFFDRAPDVIAHDEEVMWKVTERGWLYVVRDVDETGRGSVAIAVSDIEAAIAELDARGIDTGPIEREGDAGRKSIVRDLDGNSIALLEIAGSTD
jgi:hypothetical protein